MKKKPNKKAETNPPIIKEKLAENRLAIKNWQRTRHPGDKSILTKELKKMLQKENNRKFDIYLSHLDATKNTNYSL